MSTGAYVSRGVFTTFMSVTTFGILSGIIFYFGISYLLETTTKDTTFSTIIMCVAAGLLLFCILTILLVWFNKLCCQIFTLFFVLIALAITGFYIAIFCTPARSIVYNFVEYLYTTYETQEIYKKLEEAFDCSGFMVSNDPNLESCHRTIELWYVDYSALAYTVPIFLAIIGVVTFFLVLNSVLTLCFTPKVEGDLELSDGEEEEEDDEETGVESRTAKGDKKKETPKLDDKKLRQKFKQPSEDSESTDGAPKSKKKATPIKQTVPPPAPTPPKKQPKKAPKRKEPSDYYEEESEEEKPLPKKVAKKPPPPPPKKKQQPKKKPQKKRPPSDDYYDDYYSDE